MRFMSPPSPPQKSVDYFYSFDAFGKVCFQSAAAIKQIEREEIDCVEEREFQRRAEERASGHGEGLIHLKYLIFTLSEEWLFSLMLFSSIHTNSSSPPAPPPGTLHQSSFPLLSPVFPPSPLSLHRLQSKDNRLASPGWTVRKKKKKVYTGFIVREDFITEIDQFQTERADGCTGG